MTRIDASTTAEARLALVQRQRRFEWALALDEQTRAAARLVAGHTHDMINLIQIVQLAANHLRRMCSETAEEFINDLERAAEAARDTMRDLMAAAHAEHATAAPGAPLGGVVASVLATLRTIVDIEIHLTTKPDVRTPCTSEELEHVLFGLALDATEPTVELVVRERTIEGKPWLEILRSAGDTPERRLPTERIELRAVAAIAQRAGGEQTISERDGEVVVALPISAEPANSGASAATL